MLATAGREPTLSGAAGSFRLTFRKGEPSRLNRNWLLPVSEFMPIRSFQAVRNVPGVPVCPTGRPDWELPFIRAAGAPGIAASTNFEFCVKNVGAKPEEAASI